MLSVFLFLEMIISLVLDSLGIMRRKQEKETDIMDSHAEQRDYKYELLSSYCGPSKDDLPLLQSSGLSIYYGVFLGYLDLDFGLSDRLLTNRIISGAEMKTLKSNNSMYNKHALLLRWVIAKGKTSEFYDALEGTHQTHLVNYAKSPGGLYRAEFGLNWPLTEKQTTQLDRNQEVLIELLEISPELIGQLYSRGAITRRHKEHICSISSAAFRNEAFLDIVRRRSFWNYKQTIECLRTSQHRVTRKAADILEGGVVGQIELTLCEKLSANNSSLVEFLQQTNEIEIPPAHPTVNLELVSTKLDNEKIILYILLRKVNETLLKHENEDFRAIVEGYIHNNLQPLRLQWHENDYRKCRGYFESFSMQTLYDIPKEIMETILAKAFALHFWLRPRPSELDTYVSLSSICYFSFDILIKRRRFVKTMLPFIRAYYRIFKIRSAIIRINRLFLLENMKPRKCLIKRLCSAKCISKSQAALINRLRFDKEKNHELLKIARKLSAKNHFAFVECLCSNSQQVVADVLEKGGVAVKVKMSNAKFFPQETTVEGLIPRLRQLIIDRHTEFRNFMISRNLKNTRLTIIQRDKSSDNDKYFVWWFWCKSRDELLQIEKIHDELVKGITKLINNSASRPHVTAAYDSQVPDNDMDFAPTSVIVDTRQFQKETVIRDINVNWKSFVKLHLYGTQPLAVAGLGDEIYVLYFRSIHIYQGQHPFVLLKEVPIPPINLCCSTVTNWLQSLSVCRKSLCVYISCTRPGCVRKLTAKHHVHSFWLSGIEHMRCLCTMNTGNVVVLKARKEVGNIVNSLEIYSSEADLLNRCPVQPSTELPLHLVEISPLKIAINYSSSWLIIFLNNGYQVRSSRKIDSENSYDSVTMFAEEKVIASIHASSYTPNYANAVTMLDSHMLVEKLLMNLSNISYVRMSYCKETRQLITLRYLISQFVRRADNAIFEKNEPLVEVMQIKYNDEIN